jgi:hypothetical protein
MLKGRQQGQRAKSQAYAWYVELLSEAAPLADHSAPANVISDLAHEERGLQPHEYASGLHASECPSRFASTRFRDESS